VFVRSCMHACSHPALLDFLHRASALCLASCCTYLELELAFLLPTGKCVQPLLALPIGANGALQRLTSDLEALNEP
jgi:hypothetical protein